MTCLIKGCGKKRHGRGLCKAHYERWRRGTLDVQVRLIDPPVRPCTIEGCDRNARGYSMCDAHLQLVRKYGDPQAHIPLRPRPEGVPDTCIVDGCDRPVDARGWCSAHYCRWQKHGDVRAHVPLRGERTVHPGDCRVCEEVEFMHSMVGAVHLYARLGFTSQEGLEQHVREHLPQHIPWARRGIGKSHAAA